MAAPPPLARSRIPPATQANKSRILASLRVLVTRCHYLKLSECLLGLNQRNNNKRNTNFSVFRLDFRRSSWVRSTSEGSFLEQQLVIKPLLFKVVSFWDQIKLEPRPHCSLSNFRRASPTIFILVFRRGVLPPWTKAYLTTLGICVLLFPEVVVFI